MNNIRYLELLKGTERMRSKVVITIILVSVFSISMLALGVANKQIIASDYEKISLEDLENNPENYLSPGNDVMRLNKFFTNFIITNVSKPKIVYFPPLSWNISRCIIKDSYNYDLEFIISSEDYQNYTQWVGKNALFKIAVGNGPLYEFSFELVINRIAYKEYYGSTVSAYIVLAEPLTETVSPLPWWTPLAIGTIAASTFALTTLTFKKYKKKEDVTPNLK